MNQSIAGTQSSSPRPERRKLKTTSIVVGIGLLLWGTAAVNVLLRKYRTHTIHENESRIIAILKNLSSSQAQFQASGSRDKNENGRGEYGDFKEMTSCVPAVLSEEFARGTAKRVRIAGYLLELHMPEDPATREKEWLAYAWPEDYAGTGKRAFFVNQSGDLLSTKNIAMKYSGGDTIPDPNAAFQDPNCCEVKTVAANTSGMDDQVWIVV